ncbi:MAG: MFS transporter [Myxococcota bacterium]
MRTLIVLGLASGIPFDLRGQTLQLRLSEAKVDVTSIGIFSLVGLPYLLKALWAPFLDRYTPPGLGRFGRRRGWQIVALVCLAAGLALMAMASPQDDLVMLGLAAFLVAFFSASYDIVVDAYRTDVLDARERSFGAGLASAAYRMGMLLGGLATPWIAAFLDWNLAYLLMGAFMLPAIFIATLAPKEPVLTPPRTLKDAVVTPLRELMKQRWMLGFMALVFLYKLGDAFGSNLFSTFLYDGLHFKSTEIATARKVIGSLATVLGMVAGGYTIARYGLWKALMAFGILQALTNFVFVWQATQGKDFTLLFVGLGAENLAGGLGAAAFVTFITALCDRRYSAFQYALLSSIAMIGTITIGPIAGITAKELGWETYFLISVVVSVPGLVALLWLRRPIVALDRPRPGVEEAFG